ncbi:MAG: hypothetical protein OEQ47_17535, partial [Acidimicrobiia bacterium]|nr:hypothetical protein [Acidimicrobiia bacterium]
RRTLEAVDASEVVLLDTPFGFQENVEVLTEKIVEFFDVSLRKPTTVASLRSSNEPASAVERTLATVRRAKYVFAGPGSPSYALGIWRSVGIAAAMREVVANDGAIVLASAAALTAGLKTIPVYEMYKAGADPYWLDGLDLSSAFGLPMTVVPHWNNTDGGNHDTSRCYIGERRLSVLEDELDHGILGIDEHSAVTIDFGAGTLVVSGASSAVLRGTELVTLEAGDTIELEKAAEILGGAFEHSPEAATTTAPVFASALGAGDVDGAVEAALEVEQEVSAGAGDRAALRSVIVELGEAARAGVQDPREVVGGYVEAMLELRRQARDAKRYDESDLIRDRLVELGVEVRDTPDGAEWDLL